MDHITVKTYAEDPHRCQAISRDGQCPNQAVIISSDDNGKPLTFSSFCIRHATTTHDMPAQESLRNYRLTKFKAQLDRHATSPQIKNVRDEIGILRMVLEEKLNYCKDTTDLILQSGAISDIVLKIEKLVTSCHKLEGSMNQLLDKQAILQFASEMISVIAEEVTDTAVMDRVTNKLMTIVGRIGLNESIRDTDGQ